MSERTSFFWFGFARALLQEAERIAAKLRQMTDEECALRCAQFVHSSNRVTMVEEFLIGGKLLAQFILTLVQLLVLFGIGYFAFHLDIGSWPAVIALLVCTSFAATGLGILLVSVVKTRRQLNPIVTLVVLITSAIGGAWWPLFLEPQWMQSIAKLGLTAWAMEGLNGVMILGKDFTQVLPDILGLLAYGIICFVIAMRFFRFEQKTA